MNGPEHYAEAEKLLAQVPRTSDGEVEAGYSDEIAAAQVHATLALAAATAYPAVRDWCGGESNAARAWTAAV